MSPQPASGTGFTEISLAGRWECGSCGAVGDGWYDEETGLTLQDSDGNEFAIEDHVCEDS